MGGDRANRPVNYVGFWDAARFINWLQNGQPTGTQGDSTTEDGAYDLNGATSHSALTGLTRQSDATWFIPTENEWYKAAYHKNDGITGNYFEFPTSSNSVPSNDLTNPDGGNNANFLQNGFTIGSPYYMTNVGEFELSDSPYGTFDQGGNVWEWNEAFLSSSRVGVRGGHWDFAGHTYMAASNRWNSSFAPEFYNIGIRAMRVVPEPGSITLMLCGLVSGLIWWRRRR